MYCIFTSIYLSSSHLVPFADLSAFSTVSEIKECVSAIFLQLVNLSISGIAILELTYINVTVIIPLLCLSIVLILLAYLT